MYSLILSKGFPCVSAGKESACNVGVLGSVPGLGGSPGGGHGNSLLCFFLENPHGGRSLVGYSPCGRKESDTTELLRTHTHVSDTFSDPIMSSLLVKYI